MLHMRTQAIFALNVPQQVSSDCVCGMKLPPGGPSFRQLIVSFDCALPLQILHIRATAYCCNIFAQSSVALLCCNENGEKLLLPISRGMFGYVDLPLFEKSSTNILIILIKPWEFFTYLHIHLHMYMLCISLVELQSNIIILWISKMYIKFVEVGQGWKKLF